MLYVDLVELQGFILWLDHRNHIEHQLLLAVSQFVTRLCEPVLLPDDRCSIRLAVMDWIGNLLTAAYLIGFGDICQQNVALAPMRVGAIDPWKTGAIFQSW